MPFAGVGLIRALGIWLNDYMEDCEEDVMFKLYRKFFRLKSHCFVLAFLISSVSFISFAHASTAPTLANPVDEQNSPASVAIILDLSKSLNSEYKPKRDAERFNILLAAFAKFVQINHKQNEYFIIGVSS